MSTVDSSQIEAFCPRCGDLVDRPGREAEGKVGLCEPCYARATARDLQTEAELRFVGRATMVMAGGLLLWAAVAVASRFDPAGVLQLAFFALVCFVLGDSLAKFRSSSGCFAFGCTALPLGLGCAASLLFGNWLAPAALLLLLPAWRFFFGRRVDRVLSPEYRRRVRAEPDVRRPFPRTAFLLFLLLCPPSLFLLVGTACSMSWIVVGPLTLHGPR